MPRDSTDAQAFMGRLDHLKNRGPKAPADDLARLSMSPDNPYSNARIPPGDPDVVEIAPSGQRSVPAPPATGFTNSPLYAVPSPADVGAKRVLITYGREPETYTLSVVSPDLSETWGSVTLDVSATRRVVMLLRSLAKVVDLTGEVAHDPTGQVQGQADPSGPRSAGEGRADARGKTPGADHETARAGEPAHERSRRRSRAAGPDIRATGSASDAEGAAEGEIGHEVAQGQAGVVEAAVEDALWHEGRRLKEIADGGV